MNSGNPTSLMLFAAGLGTRMGSLTRDKPKPMIEVAGKPLIDHALDLANAARIEKIVVNLHYKADVLRSHLSNREIVFSDETETLLDTGGGLRAALPLLDGSPVLTCNTDAVWFGPNPFDLLREAWQPDRMDALLLLIPPSRARSHKGSGDFIIGPEGQIERGPGLIYSGAQIIRTERLIEIQESVFSLNRLWDLMFQDRRVFGLPYPGDWCDVGSPDGILAAETMLAERRDV